MPEDKESNIDQPASDRSPGRADPPVDADTDTKPVYNSWWWGVIPAVVAIGLIGFWLTGQYEEIFGIDPRGLWRGAPVEKLISTEDVDIETVSTQKDRWELLIRDAAGDLWLKVSRNGEEVVSGVAEIEDNSIALRGPGGTFHGVYTTPSVRFRYNPFAERFMEAVIRITDEEAVAIRFRRV